MAGFMPSFTFDANDTNPEELARRRALALQMLQGATSGPVASNIGEGLAQLGRALAGRMQLGKVDAAEKKARGDAYGMLGASGLFGAPAAAPAPDVAPGGAGSMGGGGGSPTLGAKIVETAQAMGVDPVDLATVVSYETGGTFDPTKKGPTTKWGTHRGLIQFGEPQARQYGVDWKDPVGSQLGANGAIAKYLKAAGVKPGMGLLDLYSAVNAGKVGRYGASDTAAGGAPGTVYDKVTQQMGGHREKALAMVKAAMAGAAPLVPGGVPIPAPAPAPTIVPAFAPPPAAAPPMTGGGPMNPYQRQMMNALEKGSAVEARPGMFAASLGRAPVAAGGFPAPAAAMAPAAPQMPPAAPPMAPATGAQPPAAQMAPAGNSQLQKIQQLMMSPQYAWLDDSTKKMVEMQFQLELQKANPEPVKPMVVGGRLVDPMTGKVVFEPPPEVKPGFAAVTADEVSKLGLPPGNYQRGPDGKIDLIQTPKVEGAAKPAAVQEYEYAKSQGFPGTFADWEASKKGNMSLTVDPQTGAVVFSQGSGNVKPLTEAQSKDAAFATRAEGALKQFEPVADSLTGVGSSIGGSIPFVGNYLKDGKYQQAEQAGREFLAAILRKDSGAVIGQEEMDNYGRMYLPRPGDGAAVLSQKKVARARALEALKAGMTPQAMLAQEKALAKGETPPPAAPAPAPQPFLPPPTGGSMAPGIGNPAGKGDKGMGAPGAYSMDNPPPTWIKDWPFMGPEAKQKVLDFENGKAGQ